MSGFARSHCLLICAALCTGVGWTAAWADDNRGADAAPATTSPESTSPTGPPLVVAAMVNGEPVYVAEVESQLAGLLKRRQIKAAGIDQARAQLLRELIDQRLAAMALERDGDYVNPALVDKEMAKLHSKYKNSGTTLEQYAASRGVGPEVARHETLWPLAWKKYLDSHLADGLEGYFKEHHKDLDGTQVRASHILLRPEQAGETTAQTLRRAEKIRDEITSGKITFEQAAEKYSAGPSKRAGGDLGFFPRECVMMKGFSKAAFALEKGDLSEPVVTSFGVHLIRATDVKPGTKQWTEVVPQIRNLAAEELLAKLVKTERDTATIRFTGNSPYFKPDTDELVVPKRTTQTGATESSAAKK